MATTTINLTSIPSKVSKGLMKFELNYDGSRSLLNAKQNLYDEQKDYMDRFFNDWLLESNYGLIRDIDVFIDNSLGFDASKLLFDGTCSEQIHATSLILGMQNSDHLRTLAILQDYVNKKYKTVSILRIGPNVTKRSQLLNLRAQVSDQRHVLVIIQQLETIETNFLQNLVHIFHDKLQESNENRVMLLFCMSGNWNSIGQILPSGSDNRLQIKESILKDKNKVIKDLRKKLVETKDIPLKIGPNLIGFIYYTCFERDPTITNVQYMFNYILHQYSFKRPSYLTMNKKGLAQLFDSQKKLIGDVKKLESLKHCDADELDKVDWQDSQDVATFCKRHIKLLVEYFEFVIGELDCYFKLIRDELGHSFSGYVFDLYEELMSHDELAHSTNFMDSISSIAKFSTEALVKRMDLCLESSKDKSSKSMVFILKKFRDKLYNNDDGKQLVTKLVSQLHKHAQILVNPTNMPFHEAIFYDDLNSARKATMPSTRLDLLNSYMDETTYHGVLYTIINSCSEDINLHDLFDDFRVATEKMKRPATRPSMIIAPNGLRMKTTAKRVRMTIANELPTKVSPETNNEKIELDEPLLKAIFFDLLNSMERQGLIKRHSTLSRPGMIKRCAWL